MNCMYLLNSSESNAYALSSLRDSMNRKLIANHTNKDFPCVIKNLRCSFITGKRIVGLDNRHFHNYYTNNRHHLTTISLEL